MESTTYAPGCFGKHPLAADYVHHHRGGGGVLAFERWLEEGVALSAGRFGTQAGELLRGLPATGFFFPHPPSSEFLVGILSGGHDRSGRIFPFAVFLQGTGVLSDDALASLPLGFRPFLLRAAQLMCGEPATIEGLFEVVDDLGVLGPSDDLPPGPMLTAELMGRTVRDAEGSDGRHTGALARIGRNLLTLARRSRPGGSLSFGLRFPLPPGMEAVAASFWLAWTVRALGRSPSLGYMWTFSGGTTEGVLDVHAAPLGKRAFLHQLDTSLKSDQLYPLHENDSAVTDPQSRDDAFRMLEDQALPLTEALSVFPSA